MNKLGSNSVCNDVTTGKVKCTYACMLEPSITFETQE